MVTTSCRVRQFFFFIVRWSKCTCSNRCRIVKFLAFGISRQLNTIFPPKLTAIKIVLVANRNNRLSNRRKKKKCAAHSWTETRFDDHRVVLCDQRRLESEVDRNVMNGLALFVQTRIAVIVVRPRRFNNVPNHKTNRQPHNDRRRNCVFSEITVNRSHCFLEAVISDVLASKQRFA